MNLGTFCPLDKNWHIVTPIAFTLPGQAPPKKLKYIFLNDFERFNYEFLLLIFIF
jgi:hypothetical protein